MLLGRNHVNIFTLLYNILLKLLEEFLRKYDIYLLCTSSKRGNCNIPHCYFI
jgi:hypothetical protein